MADPKGKLVSTIWPPPPTQPPSGQPPYGPPPPGSGWQQPIGPEPMSPWQPSRPPRNNRPLLIVLIAVVAVLAVIGAVVGVVVATSGGSSPAAAPSAAPAAPVVPTVPAVPTVHMSGTYTLYDDTGNFSTPCRGSGGYSDIGPGVSMLLEDSSGHQLAASPLTTGTATSSTECVFKLDFGQVAEQDGGYITRLSSGDRGILTWTKTEVEGNNFQFDVSVGTATNSSNTF